MAVDQALEELMSTLGKKIFSKIVFAIFSGFSKFSALN